MNEDEKLIEALEYCTDIEHNCDEDCPYFTVPNCPTKMRRQALKLIKKLQQSKKEGEQKMVETLELSAPWITYVNEMKKLFENDKDIFIKYDEMSDEVKLRVYDNSRKAVALTTLLPTEKTFGNVTLKITVIPANHLVNKKNAVLDALDGNPVLQGIIDEARGVTFFKYLMFSNTVAQFYNDQMDDPNGNKTMLYADIAKDIFGDVDGMFYCTMPLDQDDSANG